MDGYTRLCKGCSEPLSVAAPGRRGSQRTWCSERCRQQWMKDARLLEIYALVSDGRKASLRRALELIGPQWDRALERENRRLARAAELLEEEE